MLSHSLVYWLAFFYSQYGCAVQNPQLLAAAAYLDADLTEAVLEHRAGRSHLLQWYEPACSRLEDVGFGSEEDEQDLERECLQVSRLAAVSEAELLNQVGMLIDRGAGVDLPDMVAFNWTAPPTTKVHDQSIIWVIDDGGLALRIDIEDRSVRAVACKISPLGPWRKSMQPVMQ